MHVSPSGHVRTAELAAIRTAAKPVAEGASPMVVMEAVARHVAAAFSLNYLEILHFERGDVSVVVSSSVQAMIQELAADQAALLRVAELVARDVAPEEVFAAVAEELGHVIDVQGTKLLRLDSDEMATFVASWGPLDAGIPTVSS